MTSTAGALVGVFACERVINPRTARSQSVGGMIWGASHALMEEGMLDQPAARYANTDLGGYHFAANAVAHATGIRMRRTPVLLDDLIVS